MTHHRSRSHWFNQADAYLPSPPLEGENRVDVCVIGAGVTGLATAYNLRRKDAACSVAVLEAEVVGFGASGRNAGQLIVAFGGSSGGALLKKYGPIRVGEAFEYIGQGITAIEQLLADEGIDCDYDPTGYIEAALRVDGEAGLDGYGRFLDAIGQGGHMTRLTQAQVNDAVDSPYLGAAIHDARGGQFNPLKLVRGLKRAAEARGAAVYENSPVVGIDTDGATIAVHTGSGTIRCARLVLATNAYTHLLPDLQGIGAGRLQTPMIVHASVTEPLSESQWAAVRWEERYGINLLSDLFYSFAPTRDGRLLYVGGHYVSLPSGPSMGSEISLPFLREGSAHLQSFFPALQGIRTTQTWSGAISATADFIPHVGVSSDPRILYACGCWGHGVPLGMRNGSTLADLALGMDSDSARLWFVDRAKPRFPHPRLVGLVSSQVVARRRATNRKMGRAMNPPLAFS